jgi:hypothetical protein
MSKLSAGCTPLAAFCLISPFAAQAQGPAACGPNCAPDICPPSKQICTCTTLNPIVETRFHKQQVVNYCDVKKTCYKNEQFCYTVPVTKMECVTETIMVPKQIVRQVPRTEYQQRVGNRKVPYTVTQKVPQVSTICVPEHRVRYVPGGTCSSVREVCPPVCPPAGPGCAAPIGAMPTGGPGCTNCMTGGAPMPNHAFAQAPQRGGQFSTIPTRPRDNDEEFVSNGPRHRGASSMTRTPSAVLAGRR